MAYFSKRLVWSGLALGGALVCAVSCGSSDGKKTERGEAGAAGEHAGGADGQAGAGAQGGTGATGATGGDVSEAGATSQGGASGGAANGGDAGQSGAAGAPPALECVPEGDITNLALNPEPTYQVCRGAVLKVPFEVDANDDFTCCGSTEGAAALSVPLIGRWDRDTGGRFELEIPDSTPYGFHALNVSCQTDPNDQVIALEVGDSDAPEVHSVSATITPTGEMVIEGEHLLDVTYVGAIRSDGRSFECVFLPENHTSTSITCEFTSGIPLSRDGNDYYFIDVYAEGCGHAADPAPFLVVADVPI